MKKILFLGSLLLAGAITAQEFTAATGKTKGKIDFQDFRSLNLENLQASEILMSKSENTAFQSTKQDKTCNCGNYIAAMTVSKGNIHYIPMVQDNMMTFDVNSKTGTFVRIENSIVDVKSQGTFYARMTTTPDGMMYAINNNGTEMLKIASNGTIQNLGEVSGLVSQIKSLVDEKLAYGGDMIADAFGNIYIISAAANVFKINPNNLSSTHLGQISGLPEKYTVNGAAVLPDGSVVLGTSSGAGFYTLDFDSLKASFKANYDLPIYDLASEYFLKQAELDEMNSISSNYSLYPTIVKNSKLNIVSTTNEKNNLNVSVWNINNKQVYSNQLKVGSAGDFKINLNGALQPGIYILKATNQDGAEVINTKFTLVR